MTSVKRFLSTNCSTVSPLESLWLKGSRMCQESSSLWYKPTASDEFMTSVAAEKRLLITCIRSPSTPCVELAQGVCDFVKEAVTICTRIAKQVPCEMKTCPMQRMPMKGSRKRRRGDHVNVLKQRWTYYKGLRYLILTGIDCHKESFHWKACENKVWLKTESFFLCMLIPHVPFLLLRLTVFSGFEVMSSQNAKDSKVISTCILIDPQDGAGKAHSMRWTARGERGIYICEQETRAGQKQFSSRWGTNENLKSTRVEVTHSELTKLSPTNCQQNE